MDILRFIIEIAPRLLIGYVVGYYLLGLVFAVPVVTLLAKRNGCCWKHALLAAWDSEVNVATSLDKRAKTKAKRQRKMNQIVTKIVVCEEAGDGCLLKEPTIEQLQRWRRRKANRENKQASKTYRRQIRRLSKSREKNNA